MNPALLPLLVAVPLVLSALTLLWRTVSAQRTVLFLSPALSFAAGVWLLVTHVDEPTIANAVGSYLPGIAIVFVSDSLTALLFTQTTVLLRAPGTLPRCRRCIQVNTGQDHREVADGVAWVG